MAIGVLILLPAGAVEIGGAGRCHHGGRAGGWTGFAFAPGAERDFLPIGGGFLLLHVVDAGMGQPATLVR
jgi:hypothetical protein